MSKKNKIILVGILSIFSDFFWFYILNNFISIHYVIFSSVSFVISLIVNYIGYKYICFDIFKNNKLNIFVILFAFCLNTVMTYLLIRKLFIHYLISKLIIMFILVIYNYLCWKFILVHQNIKIKEIFIDKKNKIINVFKNINFKFEHIISKKHLNKLFLFLPHNIIVFILFIISIFTIINFNKYVVNDYVYVDGSNSVDGVMEPIVDKTKINLDFLNTEEKFEYLCFRMATYFRKSDLDLTLKIIHDGKTIYNKTESMINVGDGKDLIYNVKGITLNDLKESDIYLIPGSNLNDNNVVSIFKEKDTTHALINLANKQNNNVSIILIIFSIISIIIYLMINYFINTRNFDVKDYFKYISIYILLALFLIPAFQIPDEPDHFYTAYHLSQAKMNNTIVSSYITVPQNIKCLNYSAIQKNDKVANINDIYNCSLSTTNNNIYEKNTNIKAIFGYIPQIIGIKIADIFSNSPIFIFYFGRLFTCLISLGIVYLAIKITPKYKYLFLGVATMMMFVQQMVSYSYDTIVNSLALLFVAYILKLIYQSKKVTFKDYLILFSLVMIINNIKNYVYLPILVMMFFIPNLKFKIGIYKYLLILLIPLLSIGITYKINSYANYVVENTKIEEEEAIYDFQKDKYTPNDQLNYLLKNPSEICNIAYNTIKQNGEFYIQGLIGFFGWITFKIDFIYVYFYLLFFLYLILCEKSSFKIKNKIVIILSIFLSISLICLAMYLYWTPYRYPYVEGVQGRYFIPLLLPFLISFIPKKNIFNINKQIIYSCINIFLLQLLLTLISYYY